MHLIDKHMYPKNFFFAVTKEGIDGRKSLLLEGGHYRRASSSNFSATKDSRRRSSIFEAGSSKTPSTGKPQSQEEAEDPTKPEDASKDRKNGPDTAMEDLTDAMSSLQFIPPSIRFGRGGKAGFAKR
jgi:hypothetical protein